VNPGWRRFVDALSRPVPAVGSCALLAFGLAALGAWLAPAVPAVHDEFSHLLLAQTLAEGRLVNPPHEHWQHFETIHVLPHPHHVSKYLPGQGALLALGGLWGNPIVGAWLAVALAAGAVTWMLQGWLPRRWAALGGLLVATHPYVVADWGHGYWGGGLAATGGALVYGGFGRMRAGRGGAGCAWAIAIGLGLLVFTRPFEGALIALPALVGVALDRAWLRRSAVPIASLMVATGASLLAYNAAITGDPLRLPYQAYDEAYYSTPPLVWQEPRANVQHRHPAMYAFHEGWASQAYAAAQTAGGFAQTLWLKGTHLVSHYLASPLFFLALAIPVVSWRDRSLRAPGLAAVFLLLGVAQISWIHVSQYVAPGLGLFVLLLVESARRLDATPRVGVGGLSGRHLLVGLLALHALAVLVQWPAFLEKPQWALERARIQLELGKTGEQHLVLVEYAPDHDVHAEWVYNDADLASTPVLWARSMGPMRDRRLVEAEKGRRVWSFRPDRLPLRLEVYRPPGPGVPPADPTSGR